MALTLQINACLKDCCTELQITDISGIYGILKNLITDSYTTGWELSGAHTVNPAAITSATIGILIPDATATIDYDVTTEVQAYVVDPAITPHRYLEFAVIPATGTVWTDGLYTITYTVVTATTTYTTSIRQLFFCNLECCVANLWKQLPAKACTCDIDEWIETCLNAEALLASLRYAAGCNNTTAMANIMDLLQEICDYEDCSCT